MNIIALRDLQQDLRRAYQSGIITAKTYSNAAGEIGAKIVALASLTADYS